MEARIFEKIEFTLVAYMPRRFIGRCRPFEGSVTHSIAAFPFVEALNQRHENLPNGYLSHTPAVRAPFPGGKIPDAFSAFDGRGHCFQR